MATEENQQTEPTETDLLDLAMKADSGAEVTEDAQESESQLDESAKNEDQKQTEESADDITTTEQKESADKPETKSEDSNYTKSRKEQERQDRSWKKLEEEKAALRSEREKLEVERKSTETEKAKVSVYRDDKGNSADDYEDFAKTCDDPDLADKARVRAGDLRKQEQESRSNAARDEFAAGWKRNLDEVLAEHEELNDEGSEMGKALKAVLAKHPVYSIHPDGIKEAVAVVQLQRQSALVPGLETENKKLTAEIARLNKLTGLSGSGPSQRPTSKSFDEMSSGEQDAELERMAANADHALA